MSTVMYRSIKVRMNHLDHIQFANILKEVQDHLVEKGDVMYTCGGITVEDPELQKCITQIDAMDRV